MIPKLLGTFQVDIEVCCERVSSRHVQPSASWPQYPWKPLEMVFLGRQRSLQHNRYLRDPLISSRIRPSIPRRWQAYRHQLVAWWGSVVRHVLCTHAMGNQWQQFLVIVVRFGTVLPADETQHWMHDLCFASLPRPVALESVQFCDDLVDGSHYYRCLGRSNGLRLSSSCLIISGVGRLIRLNLPSDKKNAVKDKPCDAV